MSRRPVAPLMFAVVLLAMTTMVTASDIVDSVRWYGDPGQGTEYAVNCGFLPRQVLYDPILLPLHKRPE